MFSSIGVLGLSITHGRNISPLFAPGSPEYHTEPRHVSASLVPQAPFWTGSRLQAGFMVPWNQAGRERAQSGCRRDQEILAGL